MSPTRQRALIVGLIIIGILIIGFFGLRTFHAFREFRGHRPPPPGEVETDVELIRDWMTIPFISKMYHVPPPELFHALDIPPNGNQDKSLNDLNGEYYPKENGIVLEKVKAAVLANQPPPPPEPAKTDIPPATAIPPKP
ncbi:MAG TPA: hypothetical protein VJ022_11975 [Anaerolineales bacterium]|nr:hypothetical protein [Anaerolineales bacterium]